MTTQRKLLFPIDLSIAAYLEAFYQHYDHVSYAEREEMISEEAVRDEIVKSFLAHFVQANEDEYFLTQYALERKLHDAYNALDISNEG